MTWKTETTLIRFKTMLENKFINIHLCTCTQVKESPSFPVCSLRIRDISLNTKAQIYSITTALKFRRSFENIYYFFLLGVIYNTILN